MEYSVEELKSALIEKHERDEILFYMQRWQWIDVPKR